MEIKLTIENAKELRETFLKAPGIAHKEYLASLDRIASLVQRNAILNAPVNKGEGGGLRGYGGNLRQSIKKMPFGKTGYKVWVNVDYGIYVDQGTRAHVIVPKRAPFLVFKTATGWVRTKRVNHPGTKATYFFSNAVKDAESFANTELSAAMNRVLRQL